MTGERGRVTADGRRIAENIRIARVTARMTQQALSDAMKAEGFPTVGRVIVSYIESGKRAVLVDEILALQRIFDRDLIYPDLGLIGRRP